MHSWIEWLMGVASRVAELFPWRGRRVKPTGRESKKYVVNDFHFPGNVAGRSGNRNKKYADESQKLKRNRRKKPKKAMKRLYQLGRSKKNQSRVRV
jgi:hypothetical protein